MPNLTIEDIRNPSRVSGFNYVGYGSSAKFPSRKPYQAMKRPNKEASGNRAIGPRRATAEEAAQDYCDSVNGNFIQPTFALKSAGHPSRPIGQRQTRKDGHAVAPRRPKEGPGYVYLIIEEDDEGWAYGKVGESRTEPKYRLAGLQTGNRRKLKVIGQIKTDARLALEARLHRKYLRHNELGEWFKLTPAILTEFGLKRPKV